MISRLKGLMQTGEKLDTLSSKVDSSRKNINEYSKELESFHDEISELRKEVKKFSAEASKFTETAFAQLQAVRTTNENFKQELYDFKMIKADVKSRLVADVVEEVRSELGKEMSKLNTDVKGFNDLKNELSVLVGKFKSVEDELTKFKAVAAEIKTADFELGKYARELEKNDREKVALMREVERMQHLLAKERRGRRPS